jgi:hypothetical protein
MFTPAECQARAEQKLAQAERDKSIPDASSPPLNAGSYSPVE